MRKCEIIGLTTKLFFRTPIKERFYDEAGIKITRGEARKQLKQLNLACELSKLIRQHFPDLLPLLKQLPDLRNQSYITYFSVVLLMTRILSSVFYISSMIDDIILTMKGRGLIDSLAQALPDKRRDNRHIPFGILLCLAVVDKLKRKTSLTDVPFAVTEAELAGRTGMEPLGKWTGRE